MVFKREQKVVGKIRTLRRKGQYQEVPLIRERVVDTGKYPKRPAGKR